MRTPFAALVLLSFGLAASSTQAEPCAAGTRLVWLLSDDGHLWTWHPQSLAFSDEGAPTCRVAEGSRPSALAVTAEGALWIAYSGGELGRVDPSSRECRLSKARAAGVRSLTTEPVQDAGALVAVMAGEAQTRAMVKLEPATGGLGLPVPLTGDGPVAFGADGRLWRLSPGVVPELWRLTLDGQVQQRTALVGLRGRPRAGAIVTVGDTPWLVLDNDGASRFWRFDPDTGEIHLQPGTPATTFVAAASVPSCTAVVATSCAMSANITAPIDGAVLAGWKPFEVSLDANVPRVKVDGPGLSQLVTVTEVKGRWQARLALPSTDRIAEYSLRPADEEGRVCGPAVKVTRGRLALAASVTAACATGAECEVEATLSQTGPDEVARAFIESGRASAHALAQGRSVPMQKGEDGVWRGSMAELSTGLHELVVRWSSVGLVVERSTTLLVRAAAGITTQPSIDLGDVVAGTPWQHTCVSLPLSTTGLEGGKLRVTATMPEGCVGTLVTSKDGSPLPLADGVELTARPSMHLPVCLEVAACGNVETQRAELAFVPVDQITQGARATVNVAWRTANAPGWACHEVLLRWLGSTLLIGLVFAGFLVPKRFANASSVRTAASRGELAETRPRPLRALKGGRRGWYRNARCGFDSQGVAVAPGRDAVVFVESGRDEARLVPGTAPLRVFNPKTHRLESIEETVVESGVVYEAGGLWLTFE